MKNPFFANTSGGVKFLFSIGLILLSTIIFTFLGTVFFAIFIDSNIFTNYSNFISDYSSPSTISFLKTTQIFQSIGLFVLPPFLIAFLFSKNTFSYLEFSSKINAITLLLAGVVMLSALPLINLTAEINQSLNLPDSLSEIEKIMQDAEIRAEKITKLFLNVNTIGSLFINLFMMALIPAIGEELTFRALIQKSLSKKMNIHIAIFISAFIFSFIHFQFFGFLPRFLMGIFFGYIFYWTSNIWITIFAHFVNNSSAVLFAYFFGIDSIATDASTFSNSEYYITYIFSSLILTSFFIYLIFYFSKKTKSRVINIEWGLSKNL